MSTDIKLSAAQQALIDSQLDLLQEEKDEKAWKAYSAYQHEVAAGRRGGDRSLFPKLWQRLKNQIEPTEADMFVAPLPSSGANVTLEDLTAKHNDTDFDAMKMGGPLRTDGWIGTPDPAKFAAGTNALNSEELEEEMRKGNVISTQDWLKAMDTWNDDDKATMFKAALADFMDNRWGDKVSWLSRLSEDVQVSWLQVSWLSRLSEDVQVSWLQHNPELKALVDSNRVIPTLDEDGETTAGVAPAQIAREHTCGFVSQGTIWSRRPTRWLKGLDGKQDYQFAMYADEECMEKELGPKYSGQDPREVLDQEQYSKDVLEAGPRMGMSFLITATRELPMKQQHEAWADRLSCALARRLEKAQAWADRLSCALARRLEKAQSAPSAGLQSSFGSIVDSFTKLYSMLDPELLAHSTSLLDTTGERLRRGSSLLFRMGARAISPGGLREREHYLLGMLEDENITASIMDMFLSDQDPVDPLFVEETRSNLLLFANGFRIEGVADKVPSWEVPTPEAFPDENDSSLKARHVAAKQAAADAALKEGVNLLSAQGLSFFDSLFNESSPLEEEEVEVVDK
eukprot:gene31174-6317_t